MSTYIVLDLEWNQCPDGKQGSLKELPFEIIEIGAVKMDERLQIISEYHQLVAPEVYHQLHYRISQVTHLHMKELKQNGKSFPQAAREFLDWCGKDPVFCTWGSMDLTELQRNIAFHEMENPFSMPLMYYDVQKLYALQQGNSKEKQSLDHAVEELGIQEERPFHRALDDAYYTCKVMQSIDLVAWKPYLSMDYYQLPKSGDEAVWMTFPTYSKYVSKIFPSRDEALEDKHVTDMICGKCHRMLKKKFQWFPVHSRQFICLAVCPEHGYVRGKIRIKKAEDDSVYVVKTLKPVNKEEADCVFRQRAELRSRRHDRKHERKVQ